MSEYDEDNDLSDEFIEAVITVGTDEDWADFWASEDPMEVLMNDTKMEELNA